MLFINSSKLSTSRRFSISITWWIFLGWLLSSSLTLTELFQNHVKWILPAFFNCLHLEDNWWFSWHMLSETKSLPEKFSWVRTSDLLLRLFLLIRMLRSCFLHLNLTIRDNALQMLFSRKPSPIDAGKGFISSDSQRCYWALLTAFLSNWTILSVSKRFQFLLTVSSELRISYRLKKLSKRLVRSDSLEDMSSTRTSLSINSSFERFSSWLLVRTIIIYEYRWYKIKIRLN